MQKTLDRIFISLLLLTLLVSCKNREERESKYENGQIKEKYEVISAENNSFVKDGTYISYYDNGQKQQEILFDNGKMEGDYKLWYKNGKIQEEGTYKNDLVNGAVTAYDENGNIAKKISLQDGKFNGKCELYKDGIRVVVGEFKDNKSNGEWILNDMKGAKIGQVTMDNGNYKTPVNSSIKANKANGCSSILNFTLNKSTYPEIKLGMLDKPFIPNDLEGVNKYTGGRMLQFTGSDIEIKQIKEGTFIFDKNDILVGINLVMAKDKPSEFSGGFGAGFKEIVDEFTSKYKLISKEVPFVGNSFAYFADGDCRIDVVAPHLSFDMDVDYKTKDFAQLINTSK